MEAREVPLRRSNVYDTLKRKQADEEPRGREEKQATMKQRTTADEPHAKKNRLGKEKEEEGDSPPLFRYESRVQEDGDMVHIQRMLTCVAAVCRVMIPSVSQTGALSMGTGFLASIEDERTSKLCLVTNNHVIGSVAEAERAWAEFADLADIAATGIIRVKLRPKVLFITDSALDFTLVACSWRALSANRVPIRLAESADASVEEGDMIHIIQHPEGGEKHMSMQKVIRLRDPCILYLADTLPGSSGSPVFRNWKLVALHNIGATSYNQGILIKSIISKFKLAGPYGSSPLPNTTHYNHNRRAAPTGNTAPSSAEPVAPPQEPPSAQTRPPTSIRVTNQGDTIVTYALTDGKASWQFERLRGIIEPTMMAEGTMRRVYKAWAKGSFFVVKFIKQDLIDRILGSLPSEQRHQQMIKLLQEEVKMQWRAANVAHQWNGMGMPKRVNFNPIWVIELPDRKPPVWGVMEPLLDVSSGGFVKYNDNAGNVFKSDGRVRETPQAFSHFSYIVSKREALVCDLQGVGDIYTDPQLHTDPRDLCPLPGNRGLEGMRDFFASHVCNPLCHVMLEQLGKPN